MARSSVQGYVRALNLQETDQDRQALNNLGGAPIADDIALFANNSRNQAVLQIRRDEYNTNTDTIVINNTTLSEVQTRNSVFTNGDFVKILDVDDKVIVENLYIANSNVFNTFQLSAAADLETIYSVALPPSTANEQYIIYIVRSDTVTLDNLASLSVSSDNSQLSSGDGVTGGDDNQLPIVNNYNSELNEIAGLVDIANFLRRSKYVTTDSVSTAELLQFEGTATISDPSDTITSEGVVSSSPGLYLSNPASSVNDIELTRSFSSTSNPWNDDNAGTLSTDSVSVTAGRLVLTNGIKISNISVIPENGIVNELTFTHKAKIQIDGIDYYLCLTTQS